KLGQGGRGRVWPSQSIQRQGASMRFPSVRSNGQARLAAWRAGGRQVPADRGEVRRGGPSPFGGRAGVGTAKGRRRGKKAGQAETEPESLPIPGTQQTCHALGESRSGMDELSPLQPFGSLAAIGCVSEEVQSPKAHSFASPSFDGFALSR